ncbi:MAG: hypothetical protein C0621_04790 [Desulfuromonas sp.]|nr:MAG: hypothetical protein C0621_04790 [Desulfuromonas sp.]
MCLEQNLNLQPVENPKLVSGWRVDQSLIKERKDLIFFVCGYLYPLTAGGLIRVRRLSFL